MLGTGLIFTASVLFSVSARADIVTDWNAVATNATLPIGSIAQSRALATAHGAQFDALNAMEHRYAPYLADFKAPPGASPEAAAAVAMHTALISLVPASKGSFDDTLAAMLAKIPDGNAKNAGIAFGREVAQAHLAERARDGWNGKAEHKPGAGPGQWRPTPPANLPMVAPHAADVIPFTTKNFAFLDVKGPPALDSAAFASDLDEVRRLGARNSTERTGDQTAAAIFWYINTPVPWEAAARAAAQKLNSSMLDNARTLALMNMAGADAYYAAWQIKRRLNFWRPITAIREASNNPDPSWEPLLGTPPHPDYPSGHTINSGAMAQTLRRLTGTDQIAFSALLPLPSGVLPRSWSSLSAAEKDVVGARIWAGIHFRTADEHGMQLGEAIGNRAVDTVMRPLAR
jgi:hypothetical protein